MMIPHYFARITCKVTCRGELSSVPNKELVVPCAYTFGENKKTCKIDEEYIAHENICCSV